MKEEHKTLKIFRRIFVVVLVLALLWFALVLYEDYRVKKDLKPIICINDKKEQENDKEYSITCYGILYKYREYYYIKNDSITAKEFTLFFKEFNRLIDNK